MKKYLLVILTMSFSIYMFGCGRKQESMVELQEPISMEALTTMGSSTQTMPQVKAAESQTAPALEPLPPAGPYKPTAVEVQTALKNANFYAVEIDGKFGPITKKAIEEFQKANGLKADGKVGPKTWEVLSKYLNPQPAPSKRSKK